MDVVRKYSFIVENLNYARSVLRKKGLDDKDVNFIKIREICGDKLGYIGTLTKLFFVDGCPLDEIQDIFNSLIEFNINAGEALKMDYTQLSDLLLDKRSESSKDVGYKFQFSDNIYNYYRIFSVDGVQNIGSPAWCIKSKNHFDNYTSSNPEKNQQWAIIKKIDKKLVVPNTNYFRKYVNVENPLIRIGITLNIDKKEVFTFDDNNNNIKDSSIIKMIKKNIEDFNKNGKFEKPTLESALGKDPIVVFNSQRNKIFLMENTKDYNIVDDFFGLEKSKRLAEFDAKYLYTIDGQFRFYSDIESIYLYEYDEYYVKWKTPSLDKKFYFEISKYLLNKKANLPNLLVPHGIKLGLINDEGMNKEKSFKHTFNGEYFYVETFCFGNKYPMYCEIVSLDLIEHQDKHSQWLIRFKPNTMPKTHSDVEKYIDAEKTEYNWTKENEKILKSGYFGDAVEKAIVKCNEYYDRINAENRKKDAEKAAKAAAEKAVLDAERRKREEVIRIREESARKAREDRERRERIEKERIKAEAEAKRLEEERIASEKKPWNRLKKWAWGD